MTEKRGMKALELWCRRVTEGYPGVKIENMTTSWRDGLAFCALIHHFRPDLIDFDRLDKRDIYKNNELAFRIAERQLGIPALLDAEDMVEYEVPDRLSILTYLSQFYQTFVSNQQGATSPSPRSHTTKVPDIITPAKSQKTPKVGAGRLESCWSCRRPVFLAERLVAGGKLRHRTCFTCKRCGNQLNLVGYYETEDGDFVCETCPDEEKQEEPKIPLEVPKEEEIVRVDTKDEYSLDFESALESIVQKRQDKSKTKFLQDLVDDSSDLCDSVMDLSKSRNSDSDLELSVDVSLADERSEKNLLPEGSCNKDQHSTANIEKLNFKIKNLLGRDFSDTLSLFNVEPESFIADISEIIDNIINDAVKKAENHVEESYSNKLSFSRGEESAEIKSNDTTDVKDIESDTVDVKIEVASEETTDVIKDENSVVKDKTEEKSGDYPEDLNPFADDDEPESKPVRPPVVPRKPPVPAARNKPPRPAATPPGKRVIEAPVVHLNPFWSDGEPSSDEDVTKPVPTPRSTLKNSEQDSPFSRSQYGSFTSLSSMGSSASALRRKKGPAPLPPSGTKSLQYPPSPEYSMSYKSPSPTPTVRSHRKSKPAPPPPMPKSEDNELVVEKKEKNYENKIKQNLSVPDKSSYGKWKRKKGQAPGLPIPQRRRITPIPLPEFYRELEDLEIQQRELERQGVTIEQTIRKYEVEDVDVDGGGEGGGKDIEGLILQLFEIVNQKNELFRRQAELMYLRRQQRLEEEHADIEYQIRCLMGRPERNKTDSDKAQEEELIRRLVEVVERRNEIIECLDMDRKREVEEDESIHHHLEAFAGKKGLSEEKGKPSKGSPSLLKYIKKKKLKKEKMKERRDADKDVDETSKEEDAKSPKTKKKWFIKP